MNTGYILQNEDGQIDEAPEGIDILDARVYLDTIGYGTEDIREFISKAIKHPDLDATTHEAIETLNNRTQGDPMPEPVDYVVIRPGDDYTPTEGVTEIHTEIYQQPNPYSPEDIRELIATSIHHPSLDTITAEALAALHNPPEPEPVQVVWTVVATYRDSGQVVAEDVLAKDATEAFITLADRRQDQDNGLELVATIQGKHQVATPNPEGNTIWATDLNQSA